ncbi:MAG TPA: AMP-binding protein [Micromonosporaceae bacterium]|nr:AMP-binding protein [Micromonosporaceae bacterium]
MGTVVDAIASAGQQDRPAALTVAGTGSGVDTCLPWPVLHQQARRMASVLAGHGIGPGSRVGLLADTSVGLVTAIQAVWLRGAALTILPLPDRTGRPGQLAHLLAVLADARLDLVVIDEGSREAGPALSEAVRVMPLSTLDLAATGAAPATAVRPGPDDLAVLQYTSGSTSAPRGVPVSHGNLAANLTAIAAVIGRDEVGPATSSWVSWLPLYHDMGLIGFLALPMSRGCPLVLQSPLAFALRPASWLERLSRHRATITGAPNFAYSLMAQLLEAGVAADLSTVRTMISGGEPVDAGMMARFTAVAGRHGLDPRAVVAAYGLAESTLAVSFSRIGGGVTVDEVDRDTLERDGRARRAAAGRPARRLVRLGRAVPGTQIRVVDSRTGAPVEPRMVGHIEVSGPSVVGGYWGEAPRPSGGWLRTGDLGYLADGELVVCGRAKDVLFAAGRNVYPQDVEAAAAAVPGVRPGGAAAFGIPADEGDRLVVAVESRGADSTALRRAVAVAVAAETGMAPADVVTLRLGRLPKTSSGKLRRAETRRRYLAGELAAGGSPLVPPLVSPLVERSV